MASTSSQANANNDIELTKIYISPAKKSCDSVIREHFGRFGKVESVSYHLKKHFGYAFVQFDNAESAASAIAESKNDIDGIIVKAKATRMSQATSSVGGQSKPHKTIGKIDKPKSLQSQQPTPSVGGQSKPRKTIGQFSGPHKVSGKIAKDACICCGERLTPSLLALALDRPRQILYSALMQLGVTDLNSKRSGKQKVDSLSQPQKPIVGCPINKLNEDCLREIFTHLHIVDLLSTADVCNKFRKVAKDLIKPEEYLNLEMNSNISWPLLRLFGPKIESIKLNFRLFSYFGINLLVDRIATIGSNPDSKLTKIIVEDWKINAEFIDRLKPTFSRITSLSIFEAPKNGGTVAKMLNACIELKELELENLQFGEISKIKFPKLEKLVLTHATKLRDYMMEQFLSSHPQLKELSMIYWTTKLTSKAIRNLNPNIEKLELFGEIELSPNLNELNGLQHLKSFGCACDSFSDSSGKEVVTSLAKKGLPIEELHLSELDIDRSTVSGIKALKPLKYEYDSYVYDFDDDSDESDSDDYSYEYDFDM